MHETVIKVKRKGAFVNVDDLPGVRQQEQEQKVAISKMPDVDIGRLPERSALDEDVPFSQLFFEHREVRAYVTEEGKLRKGLTPSAQKKAKQILERYGVKP